MEEDKGDIESNLLVLKMLERQYRYYGNVPGSAKCARVSYRKRHLGDSRGL